MNHAEKMTFCTLSNMDSKQKMQFVNYSYLVSRMKCPKINKGVNKWDILVLDFSKAFGKVDHNLLCLKVSSYDIKDDINHWIGSFLTSRKQCVFVEGEQSNFNVPVESGIPKRSVLFHVCFCSILMTFLMA